MRKLVELLKDHQMFHSRFQQDNFITKRAGGTLYGQYKQSVRELYQRVRGLREDWYMLEKTKNKIKQLKAKKNLLKDEYAKVQNDFIGHPNHAHKLEELQAKIEGTELEIKHKTMVLEEQERTKIETFRELKRFYIQADWLKTKLETKYGKLTQKVKDKLDEEMWEYLIREMIAIDVVSSGRMGHGTYEFLMAMPQYTRQKILNQIQKEGMGSIVKWYELKKEETSPQIPEDLPMPTKEDLLQLFKETEYLIEDMNK